MNISFLFSFFLKILRFFTYLFYSAVSSFLCLPLSILNFALFLILMFNCVYLILNLALSSYYFMRFCFFKFYNFLLKLNNNQFALIIFVCFFIPCLLIFNNTFYDSIIFYLYLILISLFLSVYIKALVKYGPHFFINKLGFREEDFQIPLKLFISLIVYAIPFTMLFLFFIILKVILLNNLSINYTLVLSIINLVDKLVNYSFYSSTILNFFALYLIIHKV